MGESNPYMPGANPYVPEGGQVSDSNNPGATNLTPDAGGGPDLGGGESLTSKPRQVPSGGAPAPGGTGGADMPPMSGTPGMDQMDDAASDSTDTSSAVPNGSDNGAPAPATRGTT